MVDIVYSLSWQTWQQFVIQRPPLLPPRPILPGDRGWDDRVRLASGPKRIWADIELLSLLFHLTSYLHVSNEDD